MLRFAMKCVLASSCMGGLFDARAHAQEPSDSQYVVVAMASDIQSAVLRDPLGNVRRFGAGDMLAEGGWRLISVGADSVILRAEMQLQGRQVELRLRLGDSLSNSRLKSNEP